MRERRLTTMPIGSKVTGTGRRPAGTLGKHLDVIICSGVSRLNRKSFTSAPFRCRRDSRPRGESIPAREGFGGRMEPAFRGNRARRDAPRSRRIGMPTKQVRPSTIEWIKRLAKRIASERAIGSPPPERLPHQYRLVQQGLFRAWIERD